MSFRYYALVGLLVTTVNAIDGLERTGLRTKFGAAPLAFWI